MNRRAWTIGIAVWLLLGATAGLLLKMQASQRLGRPGLRVVPVPILDENGKVAGTNSVFLPARVLDYESKSEPIQSLELGWLPPDTTYGRRLYTAPDGFQVLMSVVLMGTDRTSIHKPQYCLSGQGWTIDRTEKTAVSISRPHPFQLPLMKLTTAKVDNQSDGRAGVWHGIYAYWFVADDQLTADHAERMWWMARDLMFKGVLQRWAYVTCFAICHPGQEETTYGRMREFIAASVPEFQTATGPTADAGSGARPTRD